MRWLMEFYNERRGILARHGIDATSPAIAVVLGRNAVPAEYPPAPQRSRRSLFERAERLGGQDASGWVLSRIVEDNGQGSADITPAEALRCPRYAIRCDRNGFQKGSDMARQYIVVTALSLILLSLAVPRTAGGEVPTVADFAACNDEAPQAVKAGIASPIMGDRVRADSARASAMTTNVIDFTGNVVESSDPQIHGMAAEGAKDATYQAAYRSCMRRKGF